MPIIGIDLSGPSNIADTVALVFEEQEDVLLLSQVVDGASDEAILHLTQQAPGEKGVVVGLDAPLSYNPGGGDRPSDSALRKETMVAGLKPGSVMPPTLNRMVYLTIRGITIARMLCEEVDPSPRIVEVHPGATMALRGGDIEGVRGFKNSTDARRQLLQWLEREGLQGVAKVDDPSDHYVAACAAALAAWDWSRNRSVWLHPAHPPFHPFDFTA